MSYDAVRESLNRCRQALNEGDEAAARSSMIEAHEHLCNALESELLLLKGALSHLAGLLERSSSPGR